jgi:L-lactate dehydrogenase complex protein LldG
MNNKHEILKRLRQTANMDRPHHLPQWQDKIIFADYPHTSDDLIDMFAQRIRSLFGEFYYLKNIKEAAEKLLTLVKVTDPKSCITHNFPLITKMKGINSQLDKYLAIINENTISSPDFARFEIGITGADYLVARTGSVVLHTLSAGGRRLSVLPPTHIVLAEKNQLVISLDEVMAGLEKNQQNWSYATIISGPSRTSDIEKQLVLGAHGPKRLLILLLESLF